MKLYLHYIKGVKKNLSTKIHFCCSVLTELYFRCYFNKGGVHHGRSCKGGFGATKSVLEIGSQYECEVLKHTCNMEN